jgi:mannobiose 2-epimerase
LTYAIHLFESIEAHSFDLVKNGYCEALTREWKEIADMRLSEKDANERKTMNTHLHILEPYTNLYRVWKDPRLESKLRNLIYLFTDKILDKESGHLRLFFDDDWVCKSNIVSYGHDIEASWLLYEAAWGLGDLELLDSLAPVVKKIARAASEGFTYGAGMVYEKDSDTGHVDGDRHWWAQAETVVGYYNLYRNFGDKEALKKVIDCLNFIKLHIVDYNNGEWFWSLRSDGTINRDDDKAGFWKCPYHNGRMCMEIM